MKSNITVERIREALDYDQVTGLFRWKVRTSNRVRVGDMAGSLHKPTGYVFLFIDGHLIKAHRAAWLHVHGVMPDGDIDHLNGNRADNRISNLRDVCRAVNLQNQRRARVDNASSGLLGVCLNTRKTKWTARIQVDGASHFLGNFTSADEAHEAYLAAKRRLHAGCTI